MLARNLRRPVGGTVIRHDYLGKLGQMSPGGVQCLERRPEDGLLVPGWDDERDEAWICHGVRSGHINDQAQRPGPRDAWIAIKARWPGCCSALIRRYESSPNTH